MQEGGKEKKYVFFRLSRKDPMMIVCGKKVDTSPKIIFGESNNVIALTERTRRRTFVY